MVPPPAAAGATAYSVRHLFTGQQWYSDIGLYDLRNRFYSSDLGRFLQPDPIGFRGDRSNLYRYCKNNPLTRVDPVGLESGDPPEQRVVDRVWVFGWFNNEAFGPGYDHAPLGLGFGDPSLGRFGGGGWYSGLGLGGFGYGWGGTPWRLPENNEVGVQNSTPSNVPSPNPGAEQIAKVTTQTAPPSVTAIDTTALAASTTGAAIIAVVELEDFQQKQAALLDLKPGETIYIQNNLSHIFSLLTDQDVYLEIHMDSNGEVHTEYVYPGGG